LNEIDGSKLMDDFEKKKLIKKIKKKRVNKNKNDFSEKKKYSMH